MTKHQRVLLILLFLLPALSVWAQPATVTGTVLDETGDPLISALVSIGNENAVTDLDGVFSIQIKAGDYTVQCNYIGYAQFSEAITVKEGQTLQLDINLELESSILQTATVTSSRYEKPLGEVTVSLEVLKPRLIENTNATSPDEVLEKVPGLTISEGQADIRGGSGWAFGAGSRVLLLVDDVPALQPDVGIALWDDLPVENIAQIEVIKGAASALYGSSALNGIINIRTAYAKSEPITKISTFYTHVDGPKIEEKKWWDKSNAPRELGVSFSHAQKLGKVDLVLGGYQFEREGFNRGFEDQYSRWNGNVRYRVADNLTIGLRANFNVGHTVDYFYWRNPTPEEDSLGLVGFYDGDSTALSETNRTRYFVDPTVTFFDGAGNQHKLLSRYYFVNNRSNNNQAQKSQLYYGEYQFQRRFEESGILLSLGAVGMYTDSESQLFGDTTYSITNYATYAQVEKKFFDRLTFSAGFRFENNRIDSPDSLSVLEGGEKFSFGASEESKPVFRVGTNYRLAEGTFMRASWGQGYRFPTIAEKFIRTNAGGLVVVPNPELTSETGWSAEIGLKQGFRIKNWEGFVDVAGFWMEYQDMIEFSFSNEFFAFQAKNVGATVIKGIDFTIAGRGSIGEVTVNLIGGYNYIDPQFQEFDTERPSSLDDATEGQINAINSSSDENILKYRRRHNAKFDIEFLYKKWLLGFTGNYGSHQEAIDTFLELLGGIGDYRERNQDGFRTLDIRTAYKFTDQIRLSLLIQNALNEEYTRRPGIFESPRSFTFRLDFNL